jgi:hypothetical protein
VEGHVRALLGQVSYPCDELGEEQKEENEEGGWRLASSRDSKREERM